MKKPIPSTFSRKQPIDFFNPILLIKRWQEQREEAKRWGMCLQGRMASVECHKMWDTQNNPGDPTSEEMNDLNKLIPISSTCLLCT